MKKIVRKRECVPEPEWTAENMAKRNGNTTFKQCGWCEYASGGSVRYDCYLRSSCSLMKDYGLGQDVYWDTPCIVKMLGKRDFKDIIKSKEYKMKSLKKQIIDTKKEIKTIKNIKSVDKPCLPSSRINNYFNIKDIVWVFDEKKWNKGQVTAGYRHHNGCVSYILEDYPDSKEGWGCGTCVPGILKDWEYNYFKNHLDDFEDWLALSNKNYSDEELDSYLEAMKY